MQQANREIEDLCKQTTNVYCINILEEFKSHRNVRNLFERDVIHPNQDGTSVMMNCIRERLQNLHQKQSARLFNNSMAAIEETSYDQAASSRHNPIKTNMDDRSDENRGAAGAYAEHRPAYSKRVWDNVAQADVTNQMGLDYDCRQLPSTVRWPPMYPQP